MDEFKMEDWYPTIQRLAKSLIRRKGWADYQDKSEELANETVVRLIRWPLILTEENQHYIKGLLARVVRQTYIQVYVLRQDRTAPEMPMLTLDDLERPITVGLGARQENQVYLCEVVEGARKHLSKGQFAALIGALNGDSQNHSERELFRQAKRRMAIWRDTGKWMASSVLKTTGGFSRQTVSSSRATR